tara:strand:- start:204 stop:476 length:273 start_codon:yes stop_codon:yes gene_type:complete
MVSVTDENYLSYAANEASKSTLLSQHGCIAVANGKIIGRGHNSCRTQSQDGFICNTCSCHAEMAALREVYKQTSTQYGNHINMIKGKKSR